MEGKDKKRKTGLSGFLRYRENNLKGPERNAFERELQKDPFAAEAEEGFSMSEPGIIRKDMETLNRRLRSRTSGSGIHIFYRIAASVAVLMVITTVFILIQRESPTQEEKIAVSEVGLPVQPSRQVPDVGKGPGLKSEKPLKPAQEPVLAVADKPEELAKRTAENAEVKAKKIGTDDVVSFMPAGKSVNDAELAEMAVAEESNYDTAGVYRADQVLMAAGESAPPINIDKKARSAVAGAADKTELRKEAVYTGYSPAEPQMGMDNFNKYIEENIRNIDVQTEPQDVIVEVSFIVKLNGIPDSIKAIKSPSQPYTDEAIRLIKEGPLWNPASEYGKIIEEEVRIRVVFRKEK